MFNKPTLANRIIAAFVIMTIVIGGLFSFGLVAVVHLIEEQFVTQKLEESLRYFISEELSNGIEPVMPRGMHLYRSSSQDFPIPAKYENLDLGYHEILDQSGAWNVLVSTINSQKFVVVENQDLFERREQAIYSVVFAGYLLSILIAWGLGWLLASHVMEPVIRLASKVRANTNTEDKNLKLASEFADDEVGQLAAAFDEAFTKLNSMLQRERFFTSDVSHELRTPLMVISSSSELLQETAKLNLRQKEQLQRIKSGAQEMQSLIETFLLLARSRDTKKVTHDQLTLAQIAQEQAAYLKSEAEKKGITLDVQLGKETNEIYDASYLRAVMSNLLRNAISYTPSGNVRLITEENAFRVEDTGHGVLPDEQAAIFQPFTRGSNSSGEGLGLGLSLVERICEYQGWTVSITNLEPQGACFRVEL